MGSGFAAGAGADMLQEILRRKFSEALAQQKLNEDIRQANMQNQIQQAQLGQGQQRIGLEGQRVGLEDRTVGLHEKAYTEGAGQRAADLARTGAETSDLLNRPAAAELARGFTHGENEANRGNAVRIAGIQGQNALRVAQARPPALMVVPSGETDASGAQIQKVVPKVAGTTFAKPEQANATLETRLQSAKAVTQTGNDIIATLKDPRVAAMLGPAMSRYNSVADFVGNPPPEFAKLAGQIESYSLANMGVHGMRSANGAEAIKQTVGANRHTPESMIAVLEGLNGFANHLLENNHRGNGAGGDGSKPNAADLIKKYGG